MDVGYESIILTLAKNCGFAVPIFPSLIFCKNIAGTTYCGPPFFSYFKISRYILKQNDVVKSFLDHKKI